MESHAVDIVKLKAKILKENGLLYTHKHAHMHTFTYTYILIYKFNIRKTKEKKSSNLLVAGVILNGH